MSDIMRYEFRLFGPRKGQTVRVNGHQFVNGIARLVQSSQNMGACARVFAFYGAYARGTPEYDEAMAAEEAENGANKADSKTLEGIDPTVRRPVRPIGERPAETATVRGVGCSDTEGSDGSGVDSNGDGHEHSRVPDFAEGEDHRITEPPSEVNEAVKAAVMQLDPEVKEHWVATGAHKGKPKLNAVESAYGKAGLTRQDIEAALPGWTRDKAIQAAMEAA